VKSLHYITIQYTLHSTRSGNPFLQDFLVQVRG
jgi:hypothetical protein